MKTLFFLAFSLSLPSLVFPQYEVPPPHSHGSSSICWAYAMVRAYDKLAADAGIQGCGRATTARTSSFMGNYFEGASSYKVGYVVEFQ